MLQHKGQFQIVPCTRCGVQISGGDLPLFLAWLLRVGGLCVGGGGGGGNDEVVGVVMVTFGVAFLWESGKWDWGL